ncbi:MAG: ABC transporter ATP-binding protein [Olsenella sp.]|nr:ABC transporter ATP-binding protein [Olsenella sp.]
MTRHSNFRLMGRMLGFVKPMVGVMCISVFCGILGFVCATALPVLAAEAVLSVAGKGSLAWSVGAFGGMLAVLAVARGVLHYIEQRCNHYIAFKLLAHIRDLVFGALRKLAPAKLSGRNRGELISTITSDIELLEVFYAHTISPVLIAAGMTIVLMVFLANLAPVFALVALCGYILVGVVSPIAVSKASGVGGTQARAVQASLSGYVLDNLRGLAQVIQYGAGDARLSGLDERSRALVDVQRGLKAKGVAGSAAVGVLVVLTAAAQLFIGAPLVAAGAVTPEAYVLAVVTTLSSFGPYVALANLGSTLQQTLASGERVLAILDEKPQVEEVEVGKEPAFTGAAAESVSFSYADEEVLHDVCLEIPKGRIVGISGRSGSGKSTFCRLLMRFWDVDEGRISIGRSDIRRVRTAHLRSLEASVEQDTVLFHDSIRANLLIAKPDATDAEVRHACEQASILGFIESLPEGFDTEVGELGDTLSGGERQRLGLARAFLHDAPFVLLDEPTSNLDALNEGAVLKALDAQRGKRTVLLVSHRPSSLAIADEVISLDQGRVS